ncbi:hypothetical protein PR202_gb00141 [Eleusine coracana subsp. coracana]|uniref:glutathione synthase n=1 Tax=Eleusine coracana subsp. coracana TaxID=191504 RepID=A0AAV5DR60_ELECO|nr:hypothetical protein PR202_gb00141 [Eleusine coracana subsp. coracana]
MSFPKVYWDQALELAPLFNELVDRNTRLGLTRSDYMVDGTTDLLLQVELNTISTSSNGLACGISELHRILLRAHERDLDLDKANVVGNTAIAQHAKALATAWAEYSNQRFLENTTDVDKVRKCFAGLWSLEDDNILISAIESPELFVLKPQREGGGNNIYGDDLRKTLIRLHKDGRDERAAYILMQRIFPPASPCYLVREGTCTRHNAVSEFGIFGAYLR